MSLFFVSEVVCTPPIGRSRCSGSDFACCRSCLCLEHEPAKFSTIELRDIESGSSVDLLAWHQFFRSDQEYLFLGSGMQMKKSCSVRVLAFHRSDDININLSSPTLVRVFEAAFTVTKEALENERLFEKLRRSFPKMRAWISFQGRGGVAPAWCGMDGNRSAMKKSGLIERGIHILFQGP